jgi:hypothetical protein
VWLQCTTQEGILDSMVRWYPRNTPFTTWSMLQKDGDIDEDVSHRTKAGWLKWHQASGVMYDPSVAQKLKGKFYRITMGWPRFMEQNVGILKGWHVQQISVAEIPMLQWSCDHTRRDHVRNNDIRERLGVTPVEEKLVLLCNIVWDDLNISNGGSQRHRFVSG